MLKKLSLWDARHKKVLQLSGGMKRRFLICKALVHKPKLLLLDEPTASLDPASARDVRTKIRGFATQMSGGVLWASHNMYEVEEVCDRVLFMSHGKILLEGNPKTLPAQHGKKSLEDLFVTVAREPLTLV